MNIIIKGLSRDTQKKIAALWPVKHAWTFANDNKLEFIINCTTKTEDPFTGRVTLTYHDGPFKCSYTLSKDEYTTLYRRDGI